MSLNSKNKRIVRFSILINLIFSCYAAFASEVISHSAPLECRLEKQTQRKNIPFLSLDNSFRSELKKTYVRKSIDLKYRLLQVFPELHMNVQSHPFYVPLNYNLRTAQIYGVDKNKISVASCVEQSIATEKLKKIQKNVTVDKYSNLKLRREILIQTVFDALLAYAHLDEQKKILEIKEKINLKIKGIKYKLISGNDELRFSTGFTHYTDNDRERASLRHELRKLEIEILDQNYQLKKNNQFIFRNQLVFDLKNTSYNQMSSLSSYIIESLNKLKAGQSAQSISGLTFVDNSKEMLKNLEDAEKANYILGAVGSLLDDRPKLFDKLHRAARARASQIISSLDTAMNIVCDDNAENLHFIDGVIESTRESWVKKYGSNSQKYFDNAHCMAWEERPYNSAMMKNYATVGAGALVAALVTRGASLTTFLSVGGTGLSVLGGFETAESLERYKVANSAVWAGLATAEEATQEYKKFRSLLNWSIIDGLIFPFDLIAISKSRLNLTKAKPSALPSGSIKRLADLDVLPEGRFLVKANDSYKSMYRISFEQYENLADGTSLITTKGATFTKGNGYLNQDLLVKGEDGLLDIGILDEFIKIPSAKEIVNSISRNDFDLKRVLPHLGKFSDSDLTKIFVAHFNYMDSRDYSRELISIIKRSSDEKEQIKLFKAAGAATEFSNISHYFDFMSKLHDEYSTVYSLSNSNISPAFRYLEKKSIEGLYPSRWQGLPANAMVLVTPEDLLRLEKDTSLIKVIKSKRIRILVNDQISHGINPFNFSNPSQIKTNLDYYKESDRILDIELKLKKLGLENNAKLIFYDQKLGLINKPRNYEEISFTTIQKRISPKKITIEEVSRLFKELESRGGDARVNMENTLAYLKYENFYKMNYEVGKLLKRVNEEVIKSKYEDVIFFLPARGKSPDMFYDVLTKNYGIPEHKIRYSGIHFKALQQENTKTLVLVVDDYVGSGNSIIQFMREIKSMEILGNNITYAALAPSATVFGAKNILQILKTTGDQFGKDISVREGFYHNLFEKITDTPEFEKIDLMRRDLGQTGYDAQEGAVVFDYMAPDTNVEKVKGFLSLWTHEKSIK